MGIKVKGRLILASASPRRSELLRGLELEFEVLPSGIEESLLAGETPEVQVRRLSAAKAQDIAARHPQAWVVGADTVVFIAGELLGKPASLDEARMMLTKLSGREHRVYTGVSVVCREKNISSFLTLESSVFFKDIPDEEKEWYVRTEEPYDKAGGYALQGRGGLFIKEIRGSYTNVVGLPLCELFNLLKRLGAVEFIA